MAFLAVRVVTKRERVILLLGSLNDLSYFPLGSLKSTRGLTAARKTPCPDCSLAGETERGSGWVVDRFKRRSPCVTCGGTEEPRKPGRGWVKLDGMDADHAPVQAVDAAAAPTRPPRMVTCDACGGSGAGIPHLRDPLDPLSEYREPCGYCGGSGKRVAVDLRAWRGREEAAESVDPVTDAIERRNQAGSYHELELALALLTKPQRRVLDAVYVRGGEESPRSRAALDALVLLLPDELRVPGQVIGNARERRLQLRRTRGRGSSVAAITARNKEIRTLIRQRRPTQWVASEFGLSVRQVNEIVAGEAVA